MSDIYPETGRTYEIEAAIQVLASGEFDLDELGKSWSMTGFGQAIVRKYNELVDETL
ncbi:hypothetical protein [Mycolicibacterium porcinum]|uniref:hypothetical protein n=1 Tax=Mycolicibacterium porcinum TaxID=39693 RepID=UPI0013F4F891|nr:hypothetical protein [Mycolicibacterium porcinum]